MANIKNIFPGGFNFKKHKLYWIIGVLIVAAIAAIFIHKNNQNNQTIFTEGDRKSAQIDQQTLANHDYKQYQLQLTSKADGFTGVGKFNQAEIELNEIMANVPKDQIISDTYRSFWYLYQQKGDTQNRKKYALLTAEKLNQEGNTKEAAAFEKDANGN